MDRFKITLSSRLFCFTGKETSEPGVHELPPWHSMENEEYFFAVCAACQNATQIINWRMENLNKCTMDSGKHSLRKAMRID